MYFIPAERERERERERDHEWSVLLDASQGMLWCVHTWEEADERDAVLAVKVGLAGGSNASGHVHPDVDQTELWHEDPLAQYMLPLLPLRPEHVCTLWVKGGSQ